MAHSDDDGLVLPPKLAPIQVVIVPIFKGEEQKKLVDEKVSELVAELKAANIRVKYDDSENSRPGWKFAEYEMKGVPVRIGIGARDIENNMVEVARRDTKEKLNMPMEGLAVNIGKLLHAIQEHIYNKAFSYRETHITKADSWDDFIKLLDNKGGFISAHWDGTGETEDKIKELSKATIRCIPLNNDLEEGACILTGKPSSQRVLFARAY
jgi:prolyl-tRNA synthetase